MGRPQGTPWRLERLADVMGERLDEFVGERLDEVIERLAEVKGESMDMEVPLDDEDPPRVSCEGNRDRNRVSCFGR